MKAIVWQEETLGAKFTYEDIPDDLKDRSENIEKNWLRLLLSLMIDLMEKYLDGQIPPADDVIKNL